MASRAGGKATVMLFPSQCKCERPLFEAMFPALLGEEWREAGQRLFAGSKVLILGREELAGN